MKQMKKNLNDMIDEIIKALQLMKEKGIIASIDFNPPHIEEIYGDPFETYGVMQTSFEITYKGTYKKINDFMEQWERIK